MSRYFGKLLTIGSVGVLLTAGAGGCLPQNFYADLAGNALTNIVDALLGAALEQLMAGAA